MWQNVRHAYKVNRWDFFDILDMLQLSLCIMYVKPLIRGLSHFKYTYTNVIIVPSWKLIPVIQPSFMVSTVHVIPYYIELQFDTCFE